MKRLTLAAAFAIALLPGVALAHENLCATSVSIEASIAAGRFRLAVEALDANGNLIRVIVTPDDDWFLWVVSPQSASVSCLLTAGSGWQIIAAPTFRRDL